MMSRLSSGVICSVVLLAACHHGQESGGDVDMAMAVEPPDLSSIELGGCGLVTCASANANCGPIGDGCGGTINCGSCTNAGETCGGGGVPSQCGVATSVKCTPKTCTDYPGTCGPQSDGCGSITPSCGSCMSPLFCGGGGPSLCGDGSGPCTGLCLLQTKCDGGTTSVSGTVYAPTDPSAGFGSPDPINHALVYVPNGAAGAPLYGVQPFGQTVSCDSCNAQITGSPLVQVRTGVDGTFQLDNVPVMNDMPLVIQVGKWRRMITVPTTTACGNIALSAEQTRLARSHTEAGTTVNGVPVLLADIPRVGFVTGNADQMECVLRKIGIADGDFGDPTAPIASGATDGHRVDFYQDNGATYSAGTPAATKLYDNQTCTTVADCPAVPGQACTSNTCAKPALGLYDLVVFACVGGEVSKTDAERQNVIDYANAGGRIFNTHYSYVWLWDQPSATSFSSTATWVGDQTAPSPNPLTVWLDTTFAKGMDLANWLQVALTIPATTTVQTAMSNSTTTACVATVTGYPSVGVIKIGTELMSYTSTSTTAGTCGAGQQRFRGLVRGYNGTTAATHAVADTVTLTYPFGQMLVNDPRYNFSAVAGGTTSQQWVYRNTNSPDQPQASPYTPMHYTFNTPVGATTQCGRVVFSDFHVYTGAGTGWGSCDSKPMNAQEKLLEFMLFDLTDCVVNDQCVPKTCSDYGYTCGVWPDGCGDVTPLCGSCTNPATCGGGGTTGQCGGNGGCVPQNCTSLGYQCGLAGDGCGNTIDCGTCMTAGDTCGGGGVANQCGHQTIL
jgi:hypothetical protein